TLGRASSSASWRVFASAIAISSIGLPSVVAGPDEASFGGARDRWRRLPRAMTDGKAGPNSCFAGAKRRSNVLELPSELRTLPSLLSATRFPIKAIHNINSSQRATLSAPPAAGTQPRPSETPALSLIRVLRDLRSRRQSGGGS